MNMVSTRGRYALRVMIDLAEHDNGKYISMKSVAERQGISLKYMEKILPLLVSANLIEGVHGRGGGYKLTRKPEEYTVNEILGPAEGTLAPVACLEEGSQLCTRKDQCRTLPLWVGLDKVVTEYLDGIHLSDLMQKEHN